MANVLVLRRCSVAVRLVFKVVRNGIGWIVLNAAVSDESEMGVCIGRASELMRHVRRYTYGLRGSCVEG
jgi:hypothetical protein